MSNSLALFSLLVFLVMLVPSFISYQKVMMGKYSWLYSWTGHGVLLAIVTIILYINKININILTAITAVSLITAGGGLIFLNTCYFIENKKMRKDDYVKSYLVIPSHIFMAFIGVVLIRSIVSFSLSDFLTTYTFFIIYYIIMHTKLNVRWILYKDSHFSKKKRRLYIEAIIATVYIVVPYIIFTYR